jgi:hypothetical protein
MEIEKRGAVKMQIYFSQIVVKVAIHHAQVREEEPRGPAAASVAGAGNESP